MRENPGKSGKIRENPGKSGKIRENPGKSGKIRGNPGKSGKIRKNPEKSGKIRENPGKSEKIRENPGKPGKNKRKPEKPEKAKSCHQAGGCHPLTTRPRSAKSFDGRGDRRNASTHGENHAAQRMNLVFYTHHDIAKMKPMTHTNAAPPTTTTLKKSTFIRRLALTIDYFVRTSPNECFRAGPRKLEDKPMRFFRDEVQAWIDCRRQKPALPSLHSTPLNDLTYWIHCSITRTSLTLPIRDSRVCSISTPTLSMLRLQPPICSTQCNLSAIRTTTI